MTEDSRKRPEWLYYAFGVGLLAFLVPMPFTCWAAFTGDNALAISSAMMTCFGSVVVSLTLLFGSEK